MCFKMKIHILILLLWTLSSQAVYISRMSTISRMRNPTAFRPGASLQRPWNHPRVVQSPSNRSPYVMYRNSPHRFIKYNPSSRGPAYSSSQWKTTSRLPYLNSVTQQYELVKAGSSAIPLRLYSDGGGDGAIHTIPAPNLSLSEKPIVVLDATESISAANVGTNEAHNQVYDVTEKYIDPSAYQIRNTEAPSTYQIRKVVEGPPISFSKASMSNPEIAALVQNRATLQLASEYGLQAVAMPHSPNTPQTFAIQGFPGMQGTQNFVQHSAEGIMIPPNALYQQDPSFLQKLQFQLTQRYPGVEFIPYQVDRDLQQHHQLQLQQQPQIQYQQQFPPQQFHFQPQMQFPQPTQSQLYVVDKDREESSNQQHLSVIPLQNDKRNVVRETQQAAVVTLEPQTTVANVTDKVEMTTVAQPQNVTFKLVPVDAATSTTTVKYVLETTTDAVNATPIYYAQVGQSVGNIVANGFYSAINDVRAAAALAQTEDPHLIDTTTTTSKPEVNEEKANATTTEANQIVRTFFVQNNEKDENNQTVSDLKPLLGVPFAKTDSLKVAYTLVRTDVNDSKVTDDGKVFAGQIVEASISEDQDFNKEKASILSRRPPLRLVTVTEKRETPQTTSTTPKITVVKAKIPPRSKLTFDDKTGEPVLRIYASYLDSPLQKEVITSKVANIKQVKEVVTRKQDTAVENWKTSSVKALDKPQSGADANKVTEFGLKLRSRMDDVIPIFDENEYRR